MIDLSPFEPCSPQLREYLQTTLDIQAPGPRLQRDDEPAKFRTDIQCRRCNRTPDETRDDVSRSATALTCARCAMAEADAYDAPTRAVDIACALDGQHKSARWAGECPLLRGVQEGIETSSEDVPATTLHGAPETASDTRINSGDSARVSIPRAPRRGARRGGRPRIHASDVVARREARRAYRDRKRSGKVPDGPQS
jgi:hypothetical protein